MKEAGVYGHSKVFSNQESTATTSDKEMKKRLDLIFCSVNRNKTNMDFEHFLKSLVKVAEAKFPEEHPSLGLKALMSNHMLPLAARITKKQESIGQGIEL